MACPLRRGESRSRRELWPQLATPSSEFRADEHQGSQGDSPQAEHTAGHWVTLKSSEVTGLFTSLLFPPPRTEGNRRSRTAVPMPCSRSTPEGRPSTLHLLPREVGLPQPRLHGRSGWEAHGAKNGPPTALRQGETSAHTGRGSGPQTQTPQHPVSGGAASSPGAHSGWDHLHHLANLHIRWESRLHHDGNRARHLPLPRCSSGKRHACSDEPGTDQGGSSVPPSPRKPTRLREGNGTSGVHSLSATVSCFSARASVSGTLNSGILCRTCHAVQAALWWGLSGAFQFPGPKVRGRICPHTLQGCICPRKRAQPPARRGQLSVPPTSP